MKRIIYVHGKSSMPEREVLRDLWCDAIANGLYSDYGDIAVEKFGEIDGEFVYYGDLSNRLLGISEDVLGGPRYQDILRDITNRRKRKLKELIALRRNDSTGALESQKRALKRSSPGADLSSSDSRLAVTADGATTPTEKPYDYDLLPVQHNLDECWDYSLEYNSGVALRLLEPLIQKLKNNDDILLLTHGTGAIVSYNCLCRIRHELGDIPGDAAISKWLMLGSPLGSSIAGKRMFSSSYNELLINCKNLVNVVAGHDAFNSETNVNICENCEAAELVETHVESDCKFEKYKLNVNSSLEFLINPCVVKHIYDWVLS